MSKSTARLDELLQHLQRTRGVDLTGYKRTTLERRIQKRMGAVGAADYAAYIDVLEVRPDELRELFDTVLINVTSFFRDSEVWEALRAEAVPQLVAQKHDGDPIRVWSAGCSSGEEAYSIAMLLAEALGTDGAARRVKVYATDIDDDALQQARRASYDGDALEPLPPGFRDKYFDDVGGRHELRKELRRCVIFGRHDLIHDAPISRIDLLLCRNAIMYLNSETQDRIAPRLHFALAPRGVLVLGKAEMLLSQPDLFSALDLRRRIFVKAARDGAPPRVPVAETHKPEPAKDGALGRLRQQAFDASPAAQIVVDPGGMMVQANRRAREMFGLVEQDQGRPFHDLEVSYRPVELRSILEEVHARGSTVTLGEVEHRRGGDLRHYEVQVTPLSDRDAATPLGASISFIDITEPTRLQLQLRRTNAELQAAFEQLQSTSEELETTNEELQSTNEELETTNEELQSTNEELETINEELQSTNESQQALTSEVRRRGDELTRANLSLEAILATLRSAVVVLDRDMQVTTWSARAEELWGLRAEEVSGKNVLTLDIGLPVEQLAPKIRACFAGEAVSEVVLDATNRRGRQIVCSVACLKLADGGNEIRGIVLVITERSA